MRVPRVNDRDEIEWYDPRAVQSAVEISSHIKIGPIYGSNYERRSKSFVFTLIGSTRKATGIEFFPGPEIEMPFEQVRFIIATIVAENSCQSMEDLWQVIGGENWKWGGWDER